jgi:hypothetical protein
LIRSLLSTIQVCYVETERRISAAVTSAARPPRPGRRRDRSPAKAARSARKRRQKVGGETKQLPGPRVERANLGHVRAVFALCGPVLRDQSLVAPPAVPAVPACEESLQSAPTPPDSELNFAATRLRCRPAARPQSPASVGLVLAFPMKAESFVVQWRSTVPARRCAVAAHAPQPLEVPSSRTSVSIGRPQTAHFDRLISVPMIHTPLSSPRPAAGPLDCLGESVRPEESESARYHIPARVPLFIRAGS